jgi:hypothetical protein
MVAKIKARVSYEEQPMLNAKRTAVVDVEVRSHDGNFNLKIRVPDLGGDEAAILQMKQRLQRLFEDAAQTLRTGDLEIE